MKGVENFVAIIGLFAFIFAFIFAFSLLPAALWYCFDDQLATVANYPALGQIPFWNMYAFTLFMTSIFKSVSTHNSTKN